MIAFQCTCHHRFEVPDDQAGADLQCPRCGRLNTVPTANDLGLLNEDGTYKVDGPVGPEQQNPEVAEELARIYRHSRLDEFGNEIDLRSHSTPLDYERVGVDPMDMKPEGRDRLPPPKYDPETGELIRPMEIRKDPNANVRAALPAIKPNRRRVAVERLDRVGAAWVFASLFKPANLVVLSLVVAAHVFYFITVMSGAFLWLTWPLALFVAMAMVAHFGNVIDETGPSSQDELPRPLRNVSWSDDLWGPFWAYCLMAIVCYGPAYLVWRQTNFPVPGAQLTLTGILVAGGTFIAPAVLLITQTSGSWINLWPPRVFRTIGVLWRIYPLLMLLYIISVPVYLFGLWHWTIAARAVTLYFLADVARIAPPSVPGVLDWLIILACTFGGIFTMHYFSWVLGHVYRVYHRQMPWAYQGPLRDGEGEPRGFAVVPKPRRAKSTAAPTTAIPMSEPPKSQY
jgi:hypothetical protein